MKPSAEAASRKILSLLLVLIMLFAEANVTPYVALFASAQEASGDTGTPAPEEKQSPENAPIGDPTQAPTRKPTPAPTEAPIEAPTKAPTEAPTEALTEAPTEAPTKAPTEAPTEAPTKAPTEAPTEAPTKAPTEAPTEVPTEAPTEQPTEAPTEQPTEVPTEAPTEQPTEAPTEAPFEETAPLMGLMLMERGSTAYSSYEAALPLVEANPDSGNPTVSITEAIIDGSNPFATGEYFTYYIGYSLNSAPQYYNAETNQSMQAYSEYKNVEISFKVPAGLEIYKLDSGNNRTGSPYTEQETVTVGLGTLSADRGSTGFIKLQGRMTGNGTVPDATHFDGLDIGIQATVSVADLEGTPYNLKFVHELSASESGNDTEVISDADTAWDVSKTAPNSGSPVLGGSAGDETVTFTYIISAGKLSGGSVTSSQSAYVKTGALNFAGGGFMLTDTLPTFERDGRTVEPIGATITRLNSGGNPESTGTYHSASQTVTIDSYNTVSLGAYAGVDPVTNETPYYTEYEVAVTYNLSDFTLPYGDAREGQDGFFTLTNSASLSYKLLGDSDSRLAGPAHASVTYQKATDPGR